MAKIVYASLKTPRAARRRVKSGSAVQLKVIRDPDGSRVTISTVDADSPTFSQDLTAAFRRNVARARRENKRLLGEADRLASGT